MEEENTNYNFRKFLFGSIGKKILWAFGILIAIIIILVISTYILNNQINSDERYIREINAPLTIMVEQVIAYDALLTGYAHSALLHALKNEYDSVKEHHSQYEDIGVKLDNLVKLEARSLIEKSRRSSEDKSKIYDILNQLDIINLKLVDLEERAFSAMESGDTKTAYSLIISKDYDNYKLQLKNLYSQWDNEESKIAEYYRQRVLINSNYVKIINIWLGLAFILISFLISFVIYRKITYPIRDLYSATLELQNGNYHTRTNIRTNDELENLGNSFNETINKLEKLDAERKQIDKAKTEFLSITSHELRSPMTPMKAQLQMILGGYFGKLNKSQKESLNIILNNTERLDKIIVDFLEISRIEAARLKFNFIKSDLNEYVRRLKEEMDSYLPEKNISIELKLERIPIIEVDPDRTMQVLRNLLTNAKKFTPEKGKIIVSAKKDGNYILFSVSDNGIGIKKQDQSRIFEPFYQADNMYQHKSGGTGLGLAICKGIVESQNGRIWFNSIEGKGTTFWFNVPLTPVKEIKPIRLLFSSNTDIENKLKEVFIEILGPLGNSEFEELKQGGLFEKKLFDYVDYLKKKRIIVHTEEFKNKIKLVFGDIKEDKKPKSTILSEKDFLSFIKRR